MSTKTPARRSLGLAYDHGAGDFPENITTRYAREAGTGSIISVKRGSKTLFRAKFTTTDDLGAPKVRYVYGRSYAEAEKAMREARAVPTGEMSAATTVSNFMAAYLERVKAENRIKTFRLYESTNRNHVVPHIGDVKVKKLTAANIRALLAKLAESGVGDRSRQNVRKVLHAAFEHALRDGLMPNNPVAVVKAPKAAYREQRVLTQAETERLLEVAARGRWHALIRLAVVSGMREGELFALRAQDLRLDDDSPHLLVDHTLTEDADSNLVPTAPKTHASRRRADLDPETAALLQTLVIELGPLEYVFTSANGSALRKSNFLRRVFHPMLESAGLPKVTFHSLRHVANTLLLASGAASHLDLAKRLGHSSPRMTLERYARVVPGAQAGLAIKAGALFAGGAPRLPGAQTGALARKSTTTKE